MAELTDADILQREIARDPAALLERVSKVLSERRLLPFIELVWSVLEPGRQFVAGWAVEAICEHLEAVTRGEIRHLLINVPPGCMKSLTTCVLWPAWEWGPRNLPSTRYVCASYSEQLTVRDNRRCRRLIQSPIYQRLWGDRFQLTGDQNAKVRFDTDHTGFKIATSVGGLGTGERGDRIIIDDPHNVKEAESDAKRESTLQWFTEVMSTRLNDPERSATVMIMQRVHDRDLSGLILREMPHYVHLCLPMEFERRHRCFTPLARPGVEPERVTRLMRESEPLPSWLDEVEFEKEKTSEAGLPPDYEPRWVELTSQDRRTKEDELLWAARFSERYLEEELKPALRAWGGSYAEAGQLQQRPAPRGGGMFNRDWWKFLEPHTVTLKRGVWVRGWDLAGSDDAGSYTVGCLMGLVEGRLVIMDVRRTRKEGLEVRKLIESCGDVDGLSTEISLPQDPGQAGKVQKQDYAAFLNGRVVHFSPESGSKPDRARPLASQAEAGNVYLVRGPWNRAFIDELALFPNGANTDQGDAASRAHARLVSSRERRVAAAAPQRMTQ